MNFKSILTIFFAFLCAGFIYFGFRLPLSEAPIIWGVIALPFLGVAIYPVMMFKTHSDRSKKLKVDANPLVHENKERDLIVSDEEPSGPSPLQWFSYFSMAYLSFLLPAVIVRDIVILATFWKWPDLAQAIFSFYANAVILLGALVAVLIGNWIALRGPRVHSVDVAVDNLPRALDGLRIVQISDLHVGPTVRRKYVDHVVKKVNALDADLIALTGDIADAELQATRGSTSALGHLRAAHGRFYVTGNHEYYWGAAGWISEFRSLGFKPLLNDNVRLTINGQSVCVAGVIDPAAKATGSGSGPNIETAAAGTAGADLRILLAHQPGIAEQAEKAGFMLQLSGHTHGGQFFPWTLVIRKVHAYHQGLFTLNKMRIYVSPGTGSWGPPVRLGTRPEITLLVLKAHP